MWDKVLIIRFARKSSELNRILIIEYYNKSRYRRFIIFEDVNYEPSIFLEQKKKGKKYQIFDFAYFWNTFNLKNNDRFLRKIPSLHKNSIIMVSNVNISPPNPFDRSTMVISDTSTPLIPDVTPSFAYFNRMWLEVLANCLAAHTSSKSAYQKRLREREVAILSGKGIQPRGGGVNVVASACNVVTTSYVSLIDSFENDGRIEAIVILIRYWPLAWFTSSLRVFIIIDCRGVITKE